MSAETERAGHVGKGAVVTCPGLGRQDSGERGYAGTAGVKADVVLSIRLPLTDEVCTDGSKLSLVRR